MEELASENRRATKSAGLPATSRPSPQDEEGRQKRRRETDRPSGQRGASTTAETDLASTIERLPPHLRSMVSLLARTVTPSMEGKMMEKRGKAALHQAASMMVAVSQFSFRKILLTFTCILRSLTPSFLQGAMTVAWAYQDCSGPLDQSEQLAEKVKELRAQVIDLENKLRVKDEELKNNEVELVAQNIKYQASG